MLRRILEIKGIGVETRTGTSRLARHKILNAANIMTQVCTAAILMNLKFRYSITTGGVMLETDDCILDEDR